MPTVKRRITRTQAREIESKFTPAMKAISTHIHNTGEITDKFGGYRMPAGDLTDKYGRKIQLQVVAVYHKKDFIKRNEVQPIIKGMKWLIWLKGFTKHAIDELNK